MVWGTFSSNENMQSYVWDECITGVAYCDRILIFGVILQIRHHPGSLIFRDETATVHLTTFTQEASKNAGIACMEWQANLSDLNPVEYLLDMLSKQLQIHNPPIQNMRDPPVVCY